MITAGSVRQGNETAGVRAHAVRHRARRVQVFETLSRMPATWCERRQKANPQGRASAIEALAEMAHSAA